jgi:hypothetical protein
MNESAAGTPGGIRFFREMRDFIRSIDPERYVTMADDNLPKLKQASESAANDADFLMMNQYFGAWHGPREALDPALDKVNQLFADKMVIISEFGFGDFAKTPTEAMRRAYPSWCEQRRSGKARLDRVRHSLVLVDYKSRRYFGRPGTGLSRAWHRRSNRQRKPSYFAWATSTRPRMSMHADEECGR